MRKAPGVRISEGDNVTVCALLQFQKPHEYIEFYLTVKSQLGIGKRYTDTVESLKLLSNSLFSMYVIPF